MSCCVALKIGGRLVGAILAIWESEDYVFVE